MLLNKFLFFLFIVLIAGCQGFNLDMDDKNDYVVMKVNKKIDDRMLQKIEEIMMVEMPYGFTDVAIYTGSKRSSEASNLNSYFFNMYGISTSIFNNSSDEDFFVQFKKYQFENCYNYELNDFNWYKSNTRDILKYSIAEICATSLNDTTLKA